MIIYRLRTGLLKVVVALSLAFLVWLYARSRHQETLDDVLIAVHVALAESNQGHFDLEISGNSRVLVSFAGPPSCIHELRSLLQRGAVQVNCTLTVPEERQIDSSYRETVRVEAGDVPVPPGVTVCVIEGRNTVPVTVHRIVERRLPVRLESVGEAHISQVKIEPATVLVRGPQDLLDQVRALPTQVYALPAAPETVPAAESMVRGEIGLVKEFDGRAIQCNPAMVTFRCRIHPRQRTYEFDDVPVHFLCPANFPWRPRFATPADGKISVRLTGPASDETPLIQAYVDLTQGSFEGGRNREPLRLQLPKEYQPATDAPRLVSFVLEPLGKTLSAP
jgi:hypothetical protein